jgi:DNA-binding transcriptional LysR family regulator
MELRHIRYVLALAEEGNFTRAAARLGISQPPLSQQIRDLETEVGTALFHRLPHGAELTAAGMAFVAEVRAMPDQARLAVTRARRAARGETGSLRIGFTSGAMLNPLVPATIREFRRAWPQVELALAEANSTGLEQALRDGALDMAFLRPIRGEQPGLHRDFLPDEPMVAALPAGHRAVPADPDAPVDLLALRDDPLLFTPPDVGLSLFDTALTACRTAGFEPQIGQSAPQLSSVLALVAAEQGFSIVPASMRQMALEGLTYRPIAGAAPIARLALAWLRGWHSPPGTNLVAVARRVAGPPLA